MTKFCNAPDSSFHTHDTTIWFSLAYGTPLPLWRVIPTRWMTNPCPAGGRFNEPPTYSEADHLLILFVEKTVGVELEEWQRRVLTQQMWAHRQRSGDAGQKAVGR